MATRRSLSRSQAAQCEQASTSRCRCRCGGALHGANRVTEGELSQLPSGDPHKVKRARRSS